MDSVWYLPLQNSPNKKKHTHITYTKKTATVYIHLPSFLTNHTFFPAPHFASSPRHPSINCTSQLQCGDDSVASKKVSRKSLAPRWRRTYRMDICWWERTWKFTWQTCGKFLLKLRVPALSEITKLMAPQHSSCDCKIFLWIRLISALSDQSFFGKLHESNALYVAIEPLVPEAGSFCDRLS